MQILYAMSTDKELDYNQGMARYRASIGNSYELYLLNVFILVEICRYAKNDAKKRKAKHLPNQEDKIFTPKLFNNDLVQAIEQNGDFKDLLIKHKLLRVINEDQIRSMYYEFAKGENYKAFLIGKSSSEDFKTILLELYKFISTNESFNDDLEANYSSWIDDKSIVVGTMKKTIKGLPDGSGFYETYKPGYEATTEFGEVLFSKVVNENDALLSVIEPTLKNWDVDRVAIIDMILLKMALCELTNFSTIPTKVTLNEFVEISKKYSTDKSKDFINGILDRLMKQLNKDGKINKEGRGLKD